jgi:hypothetical protein
LKPWVRCVAEALTAHAVHTSVIPRSVVNSSDARLTQDAVVTRERRDGTSGPSAYADASDGRDDAEPSAVPPTLGGSDGVAASARVVGDGTCASPVARRAVAGSRAVTVTAGRLTRQGDLRPERHGRDRQAGAVERRTRLVALCAVCDVVRWSWRWVHLAWSRRPRRRLATGASCPALVSASRCQVGGRTYVSHLLPSVARATIQ